MNRRNFLKACNKFGLSYATFPLLGALPSLAHAVDLEVTQGKRFLVGYYPHGMHQPSWTTGNGDRSGDDWQFTDVLSPLQPLKEKTLVLEGISRWGNEDGARHQQGMVGLLTGRELGDEGVSIDKTLADQWGTKSLLLGYRMFQVCSRSNKLVKMISVRQS